MLLRLALLLSLLLPLTSNHPTVFSPDALRYRDVIGQAALRLGKAPRARVLSWLRNRSSVAFAGVGKDRKTIDIRFTDGTEGAILSSGPRPARVRTLPWIVRPHALPALGRALVLEPFATELGLGPNAGDSEVASLQAAGFSVDQAYDGQVDMDVMRRLSDYNVVYMLTHSGVNAEGEGVIATGELATPDPAVQPLLDDHTVMIVGVVGTSDKFYGVLSGYFALHSSPFPPDALWFVNGCSMLRASLVWNALESRGAGTMVSWDNEALANEDDEAAQIFFQSMASGETVTQSIDEVYAAGHGRSIVSGTTAQLGSLGDGNITLQDVLSPPPPTDTPVPTDTATSVPTPSPTSPIGGSPRWPAPVPWKTVIHLRPS